MRGAGIMDPGMKRRTNWTLWLPAVFAVIVLSFIGATWLVHWQIRAADRATSQIADTTAPSIARLSTVRSELRYLQGEAAGALWRREQGNAVDTDGIREARAALDQALRDYLVLPVPPGEEASWKRIFHAKAALDDVLSRFDWALRTDDLGEARKLRGEVDTAVSDLNFAMTRAIEANAQHSREIAMEVARLRDRSIYATIGADLLFTAIAVFAAIALLRAVRAQDRLAELERRENVERASELEQFAGRVAHDILSPLNTVALALEMAERRNGDPEQRARVIERGVRALDRVKRLVSGLLEFARAGAKPDLHAVADVAATIADLSTELRPAAEEVGAELDIGPIAPVFVSCNEGVLTSLVANLARNAIKFIEDSPIRRIAIRALERGRNLRVEVEDTGPGLPPDLEKHVFEPYSRKPGARQPGIGLGLATVKRLAEAHRGRVGVLSTPGKGCTFWFELPKAPRPQAIAEPVVAPA